MLSKELLDTRPEGGQEPHYFLTKDDDTTKQYLFSICKFSKISSLDKSQVIYNKACKKAECS